MVPFEYGARREIGERDSWECDCGRAFCDGYMVEVAHWPGKHKKGMDGDTENGRIACRSCHLKEHIELFLEEESKWSYNSLRLLGNTCFSKGLHTYDYYEEDPTMIIDDRTEVVNIFKEAGLDPSAFINGD